MKISVVMPVFNSEGWLTKTLVCLDKAVSHTKLTLELIIIDDGSTDGSLAEAKSFKPKSSGLHLKIIAQSNQGRYLARRVGTEAATADSILFLDSRVFVGEYSLQYLEKRLKADKNEVWNGHVYVEKKGNIFARFWDAIVCIAWRRYFAKPKETSFGLEDFDYYPKGTGFFFVSKKVLADAMKQFESTERDLKFSSDDTLLIRHIASKHRIHLSPEFNCTYNSRSTLKGFLKHAYNRGQFFVDGFLSPGNRFFVPLLGFLAASLVSVGFLLTQPVLGLQLVVVLGLLGMLALFVGASVLGVGPKDALSLAALSGPFALVYGAGIWRGVIRKVRAARATDIKKSLLLKRHFLGGSVGEYILICAVLMLITFIFTGWTVLDITHRLFVDGPGDGTSGFLWLNYADQDLNPVLGFTNIVNYPIGVDMATPLFITYGALWLPLWALSRLFTPLVALNIVTMWGIFSAGITTYWLMKRLTQKIDVALFSAFAAAFVPYHIVKSSAHLAYIFSMVFVLQLAAFIALWRRPTYWRAVFLAAAIALAFYTDGYFILLSSVFVATLIGGALLYEFLRSPKGVWSAITSRLKYFIAAGVALGAMLLPIAIVQLKYADQVNSNLAQARGDTIADTYFYAGNVIDYFIPPMRSQLFENNETFKSWQSFKNQRSNPSESTLYVGYVLLMLSAVGVGLVLAYMLRPRQSSLALLGSRDRRLFLFVAAITLVAVPILFLFSLPPKVELFGRTLIMPADLLVHFHISFWRVMARFFLPLHVVIVAFAGMSLYVLLSTSKALNRLRTQRRTLVRIVIVAPAGLLLCTEYLTTFNRPSYDFDRQAPAFSWLRDQKDIVAVAEFPLVGKPWDYAVDAVAAQMIHNKKLLNLQLPSQDIGLRNALVSITNPEAVDLAVARGIQIGITRGQVCNLDYPWLKLAYDGGKVTHSGKVCMYYLSAATPDTVFPYLGSGFTDSPLIMKDGTYYNMLYGNYADIRAIDSRDKFIATNEQIRLSAVLTHTPGTKVFQGNWSVAQGKTVLASGTIQDLQKVTIDVVFDASQPLEFRQRMLDGSDPLIGQLSLMNISVSRQ